MGGQSEQDLQAAHPTLLPPLVSKYGHPGARLCDLRCLSFAAQCYWVQLDHLCQGGCTAYLTVTPEGDVARLDAQGPWPWPGE